MKLSHSPFLPIVVSTWVSAIQARNHPKHAAREIESIRHLAPSTANTSIFTEYPNCTHDSKLWQRPGDGLCDVSMNTTECDYDGGDCLPAYSLPPQFAFSEPRLEDDDGDGIWSPGEGAYVSAVMANVSERDHMYYPGALISAIYNDKLHGLIDLSKEENNMNWFYGLPAGDEIEVGIRITAPPSIVPGTVVTFTFEATSLSCNKENDYLWACPLPNPLKYNVTIGKNM